ncbi:MAG TPA: TIGR03435 family protein [Bryobacteraceae bacterium]|nr:TIGR03435 family protein [Bryobacteraceae bacterium]
MTLFILSIAASAQTATFEVASVKPNPRRVGPDFNNQFTILSSRFVGRNATLRRLIADAHDIQLSQVAGPRWLDENEYDIEARAESDINQASLPSMLRTLLVDRFGLRDHMERRTLRVYELVIDKGAPRIAPVKEGTTTAPTRGLRFRGEMRQLADLIAVQLTIPMPADPTRPAIAGGLPVAVLDKTGLTGIYEFDVDVPLEPGSDSLTLWQRFARERLGLKLENRRGEVPVVVVDSVDRTPTAN